MPATGETDVATLMAIDKALLILNMPNAERAMNITSLDNRWHVALIEAETTGHPLKRPAKMVCPPELNRHAKWQERILGVS